MALTVNNIKYSIFGEYGFMEATSDNVSKLYSIFGKYKFLPNMVQMLQIEQPQNIVSTVMWPQFVNEDIKCCITFLPDRIDVEIKEGKSISLDTIIEYYTEIIKAFELKINRIALNASTVIIVSTPEESEALRRRILNEKSYPYKENIIEWGSRNVSRKKCDDLDEIANVGQNIQGIGSITNDGIFIEQIKIDTDINTLAEEKSERFDVSSCKSFFMIATAWNREILDNIEGNI